MRHARRFIATLIATLIGVATWCLATSTAAYAQRPPDPVGGDVFPAPLPPLPPAQGTEVWKFIIVAAIAAMLTVAVVGLVASLRHARPSPQSGVLHA
jgi:hypothetical protein